MPEQQGLNFPAAQCIAAVKTRLSSPVTDAVTDSAGRSSSRSIAQNQRAQHRRRAGNVKPAALEPRNRAPPATCAAEFPAAAAAGIHEGAGGPQAAGADPGHCYTPRQPQRLPPRFHNRVPHSAFRRDAPGPDARGGGGGGEASREIDRCQLSGEAGEARSRLGVAPGCGWAVGDGRREAG